MMNSPVILPSRSFLRGSHKALLFMLCLAILFLWIRMCGNKIAEIKYMAKFKEPDETKYILLWNAHNYAPLYYLGEGSQAFINCPASNCFVTKDKNFFKGNLTRFDAIAFNGRKFGSSRRYSLPKVRSPHQKYIFFNMESAANYLVCNRQFDNFFNWTATYKLNSDIIFPYLLIKNTKGEEVGPKIDMKWKVSNATEDLARFKSKAVMWLASNCNTKSKREVVVRVLDTELQSLYLSVDKYGSCGKSKCPKDTCDTVIKKYFFYLSFENSLAEDYVTEKVYTALSNGVVPVVFGGADYSRFLPPGSYLNAMNLSPEELASTIVDVIENPRTYDGYFWWMKYYTYHRPESFENVCRVCSALNNKKMIETRSVYKGFRRWWNPKYSSECRARRKRASSTTQNKRKVLRLLH